MSKIPTAEQVQVNFRMPADLRERIKIAATANSRSMNAEIVAALESAFPKGASLEDLVDSIEFYTNWATGKGKSIMMGRDLLLTALNMLEMKVREEISERDDRRGR